MRKRHAIIIGAGVAGLTAAHYLLKFTDIKPIVLEKENCIGGLARTIDFNSNRLDLGGHKFISKNAEVLKLWNELLPTQEDVEDADAFLKRTGTEEILWRRKFLPYPLTFSETFKRLGLFEMISVGASRLKSKLRKREEFTAEDFLINRFGSKLYEAFLRGHVIKVFGKAPEEMQGAASVEAVRRLFGLNGVEEGFVYPTGGSGRFWEKLAEDVRKRGGEVLLNSNVKSFRVVDNVVKSVRVENAAGLLTFPADYFLSTAPLDELADALDDGLPLRPLTTARGLRYRSLIIVGLLLDKPNRLTDYRIHVHDSSVKLARLEVFNNWSPALVEDSQNHLWLGLEYFCDVGDELWQRSKEDFITFAAAELAATGIIDAASSVRFGVQVKIPKAYPVCFDACENIDELHTALDAIKNLYCLGRNGQHRCNDMAQSMLTALAAVLAIVGKFDKANVWKVDVET